MAELIEILCDCAGLRKQEAKEMAEAFLEVIRGTPESSENVKLSGFGNFQLQDKSQRPARNPKNWQNSYHFGVAHCHAPCKSDAKGAA
jgi:integration host factor subunit alpha